MTSDQAGLDQDVLKSAPDLWLSSRLVGDAARRERLIGLYAVHGELATAASAAKTPLAGEIRLAWWREEVEAVAAAVERPAGHPALTALRGASPPVFEALERIIEARHAELDARPFADEEALMTYIDGVDGGLVDAASVLLGAGPQIALPHTGRVLGLGRLIKTREGWRGRGRDWVPLAWGDPSDAELWSHMRHRLSESEALMHEEVKALPVCAFPAAAYATLLRAYNRGRQPSELEKRLRLIWASLRGDV